VARDNLSPHGLAYGVDLVALIKGAAAGFAVLVLGGLAAGLVTAAAPAALWSVLVYAVAFVLAGSWIGDATRPPLHGAVAATAAYLLVLPLIAVLGVLLAWWQVPATAVIALLVGGLAGLVSGRRRGTVF
jgi:hypothetical protein